MSPEPGNDQNVSRITVRLWAAARAAAGAGEIELPVSGPTTVGAVMARLQETYGDRLGAVIASCSVLVDEQQMSSRDPDAVEVAPGQLLDFLPPFAGG